MEKRISLLFGITLIVLAVLALGGNLLMRVGEGAIGRSGQYWPLLVIAAGILFCLPPILYRKMTGLGGLYIPGVPVLVTGLLLFVCSLTGNWSLWSVLWPLEVLSLALGFILAAFFLHVIWLWIPASIIGINGLIMLFCALTDMWNSWAVLWTLEFLAVGLPLLVIGMIRRIDGLKLAGLILCSIAVVCFTVMSSVISSVSWLFGLVGAGMILLLGIFLVVSALLRRS